jgi:hypothetical protein
MTTSVRSTEHEGQSHRQAGQLTFSLSDAMRIAMIRPPKPESSMSTAAPVRIGNWSCTLFFDGEWMRRIRWLASCISGDANVAAAK